MEGEPSAPPRRPAPRPGGQLELGLHPGVPAQAARRGWRATAHELPVLRPRSEQPRPHAAQSPAAPLPLRGNERPRLRRPDAFAPGAGDAARGDRRVARRQRPAEVARREPGAEGGRGRGGGFDAVRSRRERALPRDDARAALRRQLSRDAADQGGRGRPPFSRGRVEDGHRRAPCARGPSGNSTMRPTRPCTASRERTTTTAARARSGSSRAWRRARSAFRPRTIPSCRPRRSSAREAVASPAIDFRVTRHGGHIGFVAGAWPGRPRYWAEEFVLSWLAGALPEARS